MSDTRDHAETAPSAHETRWRTFIDDEGQSWTVSEQPFAEYDRRGGHSLIFESDLAVRRVRNYPADWFHLSNAALAALSWHV
jgi:hypothetical protein